MSNVFNPNKARVDASQFAQPSWLVHERMVDFEVEDAWRLPIVLTADQTISLVRDVLFRGLANIQEGGAIGFLFKLRLALGQIFRWDDKRAPGEQAPLNPFAGSFITDDESLDELQNATVAAGLHLGRVPLGDGRYSTLMTIYVKPNGFFGRMYMALIKPFRYLIVYPALMRMVKREWEHGTDSN